jgi:hypothetical protein
MLKLPKSNYFSAYIAVIKGQIFPATGKNLFDSYNNNLFRCSSTNKTPLVGINFAADNIKTREDFQRVMENMKDRDLSMVVDNNGNSLLHIAVIKGYKDLVHTMLNRGLSAHSRNFANVTPLDLASRESKNSILRIFKDNNKELKVSEAECARREGNSKGRIIKYKAFTLNDLLQLPKKPVQIYQDSKKTKIDQVIIIDDYYSSRFKNKKISISPGDWLIRDDNEIIHLNPYKAKVLKIYGYHKITGEKLLPGTLFTEEQVKSAAAWWSINLYLNRPVLVEKGYNNKEASVNEFYKLKNCFEEAINREIYNLKAKTNNIGIYELQLTSRDVEKLAEGNNIYFSKPIPFTSMEITSNGLNKVKGRITFKPANLKYFSSKDTSFKDSAYICVKGYEFRIVEINTEELVEPIYVCYNLGTDKEYIAKTNYHRSDVHKDKLYLKLFKKYFQENKLDKFYNCKDEELVSILYDPKQIKETFNSSAHIAYSCDKMLIEDATSHNINLKLKYLGSQFYCYISTPHKAACALNEGVIDHSSDKVKVGDLLLKESNSEKLSVLSNRLEANSLACYRCDKNSQIIDNTPLYPGEELIENNALMGIAATVGYDEVY